MLSYRERRLIEERARAEAAARRRAATGDASDQPSFFRRLVALGDNKLLFWLISTVAAGAVAAVFSTRSQCYERLQRDYPIAQEIHQELVHYLFSFSEEVRQLPDLLSVDPPIEFSFKHWAKTTKLKTKWGDMTFRQLQRRYEDLTPSVYAYWPDDENQNVIFIERTVIYELAQYNIAVENGNPNAFIIFSAAQSRASRVKDLWEDGTNINLDAPAPNQCQLSGIVNSLIWPNPDPGRRYPFMSE